MSRQDSDSSVLEVLDVGVMVFGPDLALRHLNPRAAACWASSVSDMLAPNAPDATFLDLDGAPLASADTPVAHAARTRHSVQDVVLRIGADHWRVTATPRLDDAGALDSVVVTLHPARPAPPPPDGIVSRLKLAAVLESMEDAVFIADADGRFVDFNSAFARIHRFASREACLHTLQAYPDVLEVLAPDGRLLPLEEWAIPRALRGETATGLEFRLRRRDSGESWLGSYSFAPIRDAEQAIVGAVAVGRDITASRRAEQALAASEQRFRTLIEDAPEAIVVHRDQRILFVNPAALTLFGAHDAADLLGSDVLLRVAPENRTRALTRIAEQQSSAARLPVNEQEFLRLDGTRVPVEASVTGIEFDGAPALLSFARDISARRRAEAERAALQVELLQAQKLESLGRLAGGVAHDFNNLLQVQKGYCSLLATRLAGHAEARAQLAEIEACTDKASALTRQLLAFGRKQMIETCVFDLAHTVTTLSTMLRRLLGEDVALEVATPGTPCWVEADRGQIEQVLVNLAVNARDAMPDGGRLRVTLAERVVADGRADVELTVSDDGVGMDAALLERIFEPFFTTKDAGIGTGLGLATVHAIVLQNGGRIEVDSAPGAGTSFRVSLPASAPPVREASAAETHDAPQAAPAGELVLVVEDEAPLRELARILVSELGYVVSVAADGHAALAMVEREGLRPTILLTDVIMPDMDGRRLVERLRALLPALKVIYMSGYTDSVLTARGVLEDAAAFLQKPFGVEALAAKLAACRAPAAS
ncbi:MAG: PAS domain S-box protein [Gammaproteobacteria bacterium]